VLAELAPAERYSRRAPTRLHMADSAAEEWRRFYGILTAELPRQRLYAVSNALVIDKGEMIVGGNLMRDTTENVPVTRQQAKWRKQPPEAARTIEEPVLYTTKYGVHNYGHCLTDIVPRVAIVARLHPELRIAMHPGVVSAAREAMAMLGVDLSRLLPLDDQPTLLRQARFASLCGVNPLLHSPTALALLRDCIEPALAAAARIERPKRLFVTRADARTRHLTNHAEIAKRLSREGFVEVATGKLPFAEQVALFAQAEEIVGIAGASLTNLLFCRPGTKVTVLAPARMPALYFWDLASQGQLDYRIGYFPTAEAPPPKGKRWRAWLGQSLGSSARGGTSLHQDFRVPVDAIGNLRAP